MILEGLVTTLDANDDVNIAPMGPHIDPAWPPAELTRFELRPYSSSRTWANLRVRPQGVLHVSDDVLLLARAAIGPVQPLPPLLPARHIPGRVLAEACRAYEFRITEMDTRSERLRLTAEVVHGHRLRDFFGLNRAMFAVVEAAILATRTRFLPLDQIEEDYRRLAILVDKTGGPREHEAFALLQAHLAREITARNSP